MKKAGLWMALLLVLLTGCSSKTPKIDAYSWVMTSVQGVALPAGPRPAVPLFSGVGRGSGQPLMTAAPTGIDHPQLFQGLERLVIEGGPLPLAIGPARPAGGIPLVPVQPQPPKVLYQKARPGLPGSLRVQVLYPQHHPPSRRPGIQPGQQEGEEIAQVHPPAGAGCKTALFAHIRRSSFRIFPTVYHKTAGRGRESFSGPPTF